MLIYRLETRHPGTILDNTAFYILGTAFSLACKLEHDDYFSNKWMAKVCEMTLGHLNLLEERFWRMLDNRLLVTRDDIEEAWPLEAGAIFALKI